MVYSDLSYAYKRLRDTLGPDRVSQDTMEMLTYGHDFAPLPKQAALNFDLRPDLMVLPRSTQEVVRIVRLARELDFPVVIRGGGTSSHGGSVPNVGGILLAMNLMRDVRGVDEERRRLTLEAGATWWDAREAAEAAGMFLPVTSLFHRSSTVGGHVSNGEVGIGTYKYGPVTNWVRSLRVVLPDGETVETGERDFDLGATNYNLTGLFAGAEGTLGVVTEATLRLLPAPEKEAVAAYRFESFEALAGGLRALAGTPVTPYHIAFYDEAHLLLLREVRSQQLGVPARPVQPEEIAEIPVAPGVLVVAFEGSAAQVAAEQKAADKVLTEAGGGALEDDVAASLWEDRWEPYRARRITGGLVVTEGIVPLRRLAETRERATRAADKLGMDVALHGFLTDPDSAYVAPYVLADERTLRGQLSLAYTAKAHRAFREVDGHPLGLGLLLTYNLEEMYGPVAGHMRNVKAALDPKNHVNKGKTVATFGRRPPLFPFGDFEVSGRMMRGGLRILAGLRRLLPPQRFLKRIRRRG